VEDTIERKSWPDLCKGIAILLVVFGHAIGYVSTYGDGSGESSLLMAVDRWIYSFHMPLFFFVSGYLQQISETRRLYSWRCVKSKLIALMVPYVIFSIVFWLFKFVFSKSVSNPVSIEDLLLIGIFPLSDLWFIYAITIFYLVRVLLVKGKIDDKLVLIVALCISVIFVAVDWKGDISRTALPRMGKNITYYITGIMVPKFLKFNIRTERRKFAIGLICLFLGMCCCFFDFSHECISSVFKIFTAYCSIFAFYYLSQTVNNKCLQFLGRNSIYVYLVHDYAVCATVIVLWGAGVSSYFLTFLATAAGIAFSVGVVWSCSKIKVLDIAFRPQRVMKL